MDLLRDFLRTFRLLGKTRTTVSALLQVAYWCKQSCWRNLSPRDYRAVHGQNFGCFLLNSLALHGWFSVSSPALSRHRALRLVSPALLSLFSGCSLGRPSEISRILSCSLRATTRDPPSRTSELQWSLRCHTHPSPLSCAGWTPYSPQLSWAFTMVLCVSPTERLPSVASFEIPPLQGSALILTGPCSVRPCNVSGAVSRPPCPPNQLGQSMYALLLRDVRTSLHDFQAPLLISVSDTGRQTSASRLLSLESEA